NRLPWPKPTCLPPGGLTGFRELPLRRPPSAAAVDLARAGNRITWTYMRILPMKGILVALGTLALASGLGTWYWHNAGSAGTAFRTAALERGNLLATISATGTIEPEEVIDIGAQVAGMIKNFGRDPRDSSKAIDYGSVVDEGTILAQIDDALYKAQAEQF